MILIFYSKHYHWSRSRQALYLILGVLDNGYHHTFLVTRHSVAMVTIFGCSPITQSFIFLVQEILKSAMTGAMTWKRKDAMNV